MYIFLRKNTPLRQKWGSPVVDTGALRPNCEATQQPRHSLGTGALRLNCEATQQPLLSLGTGALRPHFKAGNRALSLSMRVPMKALEGLAQIQEPAESQTLATQEKRLTFVYLMHCTFG